MMHDKLTIERIKKAHPLIREELNGYYLECNNKLPKGVRLRFSHVYRTNEEQDELFAKRPKVTNAKGGQSIHNYGLAVDFVVLIDKDKNGTFESLNWDVNSEYWKIVINYFKSKGWESGGDWVSFKDYPHLQKKNADGSSLRWQDLKLKIESGLFILDNGIKYPIIDL